MNGRSRLPLAGVALVLIGVCAVGRPVLAKSAGPSTVPDTGAVCVIPPNDACTNAIPVTSADTPYHHTGNTFCATNEGNEPDTTCAAQDPGTQSHSVWFAYANTGGSSEEVVVYTGGSNYDTVLQVYTGVCGALVPVTCNDDTSSLQSLVTFSAVPGRTYLIKVAAYAGTDGGDLVFSLTAIQQAPAASPATLAMLGALLVLGGAALVRRRQA